MLQFMYATFVLLFLNLKLNLFFEVQEDKILKFLSFMWSPLSWGHENK
jgi:hypothetical protein